MKAPPRQRLNTEESPLLFGQINTHDSKMSNHIHRDKNIYNVSKSKQRMGSYKASLRLIFVLVLTTNYRVSYQNRKPSWVTLLRLTGTEHTTEIR